ncbi:MAG: hypothetical protein P4L50_05530 [Anaerolineaceae bacterium]|nr:hypothetical protein [Anaerolineaceae bacterium]
MEENLTLRLLYETGEVDISFFERLYGAGNSYGTYTQRYKPTFDTVKKNLVRRGLVVMAEVKTRGDTVQLQRWRFALPPEFAPYLNLLPSVQNSQTGQVNESLIRKKLFQLINPGPSISENSLAIMVKQGSLYLNDQIFSIVTLRDDQIRAWERNLKVFRPNVPGSLSPVEAVLKLLSSENWTNPKVIEPVLKIFCFGGNIPAADKFLRKGWELGLLSKLEIASIAHYRLVPAPTSNHIYPPALDWADTVSIPDSVKIDLQRIPLYDLEQLNILALLVIENRAMIASPSLVKLGRSSSVQRSSGFSNWLAEHVPGFGAAMEMANARWGKTILHENLLFARVRDLSLRVQLERELKDKILVLGDHFIAFPLESRSNVEKILKKSGFVVKTVKS